MQNPGFITLNGHRIKIQRWHRDPDAITFTTVIRGEHLGNDLVAAVQLPQVHLVMDGDTTLTGSARILDRRVSGAGPTAVHRLEMLFTFDAATNEATTLSVDQKLDLILAELRALRREVEALHNPGAPGPQGGIAPPSVGMTMLDFEIPVDEENPD